MVDLVVLSFLVVEGVWWTVKSKSCSRQVVFCERERVVCLLPGR